MQSIFKMLTTCLLLLSSTATWAHDTWVQTNTNVVRAGDAMHIDLMLGNHGNDHRDFKLAGKVALKGCTLQVVAPDGREYDLIDRLKDVGYTPNEGFWTTRFVASEPGVYVVTHTFDQVMSYAPVRAVKTAKTCFVISPTLDRIAKGQLGCERVLG